tara:strand:+ start:72 stop:1118 length:1047 start_codon:yes stop_codon:yes gene_type:complete
MPNFLSSEERTALRKQHKKERDGRIRDRIKAVLAYDQGWSYRQIAELLLLSDDAIRQHIVDFQTLDKLKPENGGSSEKLSVEQCQALGKHLHVHTYLYVKDIVSYVKITYGITYSVPGMCDWLHRHGFSYKKPSLVPGKADIERQKRWITEYEALKQGLDADESICFMDGVHPTHNTQLAYGWIKKGFRKEIQANSGRSRVNLSGAIDVLSHKVVVQEDPTLNASATISFLQRLERAYPACTTVHAFCDNAPYYRNKAVTEYLQTSKIKLHFLPPYSPNLNPIERLWKWMKQRVLYNTYYEHFDEFKVAIFGFFEALARAGPHSELAAQLASRVRDKFSPIGAPVSDS